jgi:hypothetical protein
MVEAVVLKSPLRTPLNNVGAGVGIVVWASLTFAIKSAFRQRPRNWTLIIILLGLVLLVPLAALIAGFLAFGGGNMGH